MRELTTLNLHEDWHPSKPEDKNPEKKEGEESRIEQHMEVIAHEICDTICDDLPTLKEGVKELFPNSSDSEHENIINHIRAPEGRKKLTEALVKALKHVKGSSLIVASAELLEEVAAKVVVRQAIEITLGPTLIPAVLAGLVTGIGLEVLHETRTQKNHYSLPEVLDRLRNEPDPEKKAALVAQIEEVLSQAKKENASPEIIDELSDCAHAARTVLKASLDMQNGDIPKDLKAEIKYLLDLSSTTREKYPREIKRKSKEIMKIVHKEVTDTKLDFEKIAKAGLEGTLYGIIGTVAAYAMIFVGTEYVRIASHYITHELELLFEKVFSESLYESGDRLSPKVLGKLIENMTTKVIGHFYSVK